MPLRTILWGFAILMCLRHAVACRFSDAGATTFSTDHVGICFEVNPVTSPKVAPRLSHNSRGSGSMCREARYLLAHAK